MNTLWDILETIDNAINTKVEALLLVAAFTLGIFGMQGWFAMAMVAYVLGNGTLVRVFGPAADKQDIG